jgi:polysaccharide export outer membrane protein
MRLRHRDFRSARAVETFFLSARALALALIVALAGLTACQPPPPLAPPASPPWMLGAGDHLRIIVFEQNPLSGEFTVDEDGAVSLPLIGRIKIAGMLPADAERVITGQLGQGLVKNPKVNIDVLRYRPVYVYGEVTKPGAYEFAGNLYVPASVTLAGGFTYRAKVDAVTITRFGDPVQQPYSVTGSTLVGPGDVIYVPERWF